ncbi:MAG TPA: siderophore-interacting protein [Polyangiaceae bacterium]|nr:siderophore-interacting protein [Polyangiaceae bacterium]
MASFGKTISDSLKRLLFRELTVARVVGLSEHFMRVDFVAEGLRGVRCSPGDKVQIAFDGGPRTYTPFAFDSVRGALSVLLYLHGDGPSARWAKGVREGARVFAFGPRSSLALAAEAAPIALFGDETSFAVGRALLEARAGAGDCSFVFEVTHASEAQRVLDTLGLPNAWIVERQADESHLVDVQARLRAAVEQNAETRLVLSGKAASIQALRKGFKAESVAHAGQLVKAYWSPGKRGLD